MTIPHEQVIDLIEEVLERKGIINLEKRTSKFIEATQTAFRLIQVDPHQWSSRPCPTCKSVSALTGHDFGCVLYAKQEEERLAEAEQVRKAMNENPRGHPY